MSLLVGRASRAKVGDKRALLRRVGHVARLGRYQLPQRAGERRRIRESRAALCALRQPLGQQASVCWLHEVQRRRLDQVVVVAAEWGGSI
jgi:hypothetical protein